MATSKILGGYEKYTIATNCNAYRKNGIVTVVFNFINTNNYPNRTLIGYLPVGWRPPEYIFAKNISGDGYGDVGNDGKVEAFGASNNDKVTCTITYVAIN